MMKKWWIAVLGLIVASVTQAAAQGTRLDVKDAEGKTLGHVVLCSSCKTADGGGGEKCHEGAEHGWLDGKPCGACLLQSNWGVMIRHPRDLVVTGRLVLADGTPATKHYAKMFLPNGWGARTQANEDGAFRLRMGATEKRETGDPLAIDLGDRVDVTHEGNEQFSIFLLPDAFAPCAETGQKP